MEVDNILSYHDLVTAEKAPRQRGMKYVSIMNFALAQSVAVR
jgi:hypothetical protein